MDSNWNPSFTVNVGEDCPVFDGLFEFCQLSTGGSVGKCPDSVLKVDLNLVYNFWVICLKQSFLVVVDFGNKK